MVRSPSICGVVLAAGFSSRMGRDKALLPWPPVADASPAVNTFLGATIDLLQAQTDLVIVVGGKNAPEIGPVVYEHAAFLTINPDPAQGQFSSLQIGLQEVLNRGRDTALVALVDRPPVLPTTVEALRHAFQQSSADVWTVVPEVERERARVHGHPILIGREMIEAFLRAPANTTARDVEHQYQQHVRYIAVNDARAGMNINTLDDYKQLLASETISAGSSF